MSSVFGIDIGIRSIAVARVFDDGAATVAYKVVPRASRWHELHTIGQFIATLPRMSPVFVEEPPLAGVKNVRTAFQLNQTFGSILAASRAVCYGVTVTSWKEAVCGHGSADKEFVADWLRDHHPEIHRACDGDQNLVDAACIALYGRILVAEADREGAVGAGRVDLPL